MTYDVLSVLKALNQFRPRKCCPVVLSTIQEASVPISFVLDLVFVFVFFSIVSFSLQIFCLVFFLLSFVSKVNKDRHAQNKEKKSVCKMI